jgi:hypothetical protein
MTVKVRVNPMTVKVDCKCRYCGVIFPGTYKSRYCCNAHRQAAYRNRLKLVT